jgi:hypothetical protein
MISSPEEKKVYNDNVILSVKIFNQDGTMLAETLINNKPVSLYIVWYQKGKEKYFRTISFSNKKYNVQWSEWNEEQQGYTFKKMVLKITKIITKYRTPVIYQSKLYKEGLFSIQIVDNMSDEIKSITTKDPVAEKKLFGIENCIYLSLYEDNEEEDSENLEKYEANDYGKHFMSGKIADVHILDLDENSRNVIIFVNWQKTIKLNMYRHTWGNEGEIYECNNLSYDWRWNSKEECYISSPMNEENDGECVICDYDSKYKIIYLKKFQKPK